MSMQFSREEIVQDDFLFVSYSHRDKIIVDATVNALLRLGLRVWGDGDLRTGDDWIDEVQKLIQHPHCRGILFFNSPNAYQSEAVHKERLCALEKQAQGRVSGTEFYTFPVNLDGRGPLGILKAVFDSCSDQESELERALPLDFLPPIAQLFPSKRLYQSVTEDTAADCAKRLFADIEKVIPRAINVGARAVKELAALERTQMIGGLLCVRFGLYKNAPVYHIPFEANGEPARIERHGEIYLIENDGCFSSEPMKWLRLYSDGEYTTLISEYIIETRSAYDITKWLNETFRPIAFSAEESAMICDIRLATAEDLSKAENASFMKALPNDRILDTFWWIDAFGRGVYQKFVDSSGNIYHNGSHYRHTLFGVRPVVTVRTEQLLHILQTKKG